MSWFGYRVSGRTRHTSLSRSPSIEPFSHAATVVGYGRSGKGSQRLEVCFRFEDRQPHGSRRAGIREGAHRHPDRLPGDRRAVLVRRGDERFAVVGSGVRSRRGEPSPGVGPSRVRRRSCRGCGRGA